MSIPLVDKEESRSKAREESSVACGVAWSSGIRKRAEFPASEFRNASVVGERHVERLLIRDKTLVRPLCEHSPCSPTAWTRSLDILLPLPSGFSLRGAYVHAKSLFEGSGALRKKSAKIRKYEEELRADESFLTSYFAYSKLISISACEKETIFPWLDPTFLGEEKQRLRLEEPLIYPSILIHILDEASPCSFRFRYD